MRVLLLVVQSVSLQDMLTGSMLGSVIICGNPCKVGCPLILGLKNPPPTHQPPGFSLHLSADINPGSSEAVASSHSPHSSRLLPPTTTFMEPSHVQKHN